MFLLTVSKSRIHPVYKHFITAKVATATATHQQPEFLCNFNGHLCRKKTNHSCIRLENEAGECHSTINVVCKDMKKLTEQPKFTSFFSKSSVTPSAIHSMLFHDPDNSHTETPTTFHSMTLTTLTQKHQQHSNKYKHKCSHAHETLMFERFKSQSSRWQLGYFHFKCSFLHLLTLSSVFHTFLKIKIWNKCTHLWMNPPTHFTSLKKIYIFLQSLVEGHFLLYLFCSSV